MSDATRTFLSWTKSKIGHKASLSDALTLLDKSRPSTKIGNRLTIQDINRNEIAALLKSNGEMTLKEFLGKNAA